MKHLAIIITLFLGSNLLFSQDKKFVSERYKIINDISEEVTSDDFFNLYQDKLGLSDDDVFLAIETPKSVSKNKHKKYKQFYKDIAVVGGTYILHEREGKVYATNGNYYDGIDIDIIPKISSDHALQIGINHMSANNEIDAAQLRSNEEIGLKIMDNMYPKRSNNFSLVYEIEISADDHNHHKRLYYINAHDGRIINTMDQIHDHSVPAKAETFYYGEQEFIVDSIGPNQYILSDSTRGNGNSTFNMGPFILFESTNNEWVFDDYHTHVALDVHWGTQSYYDVLLEKLNWSGIDGMGRSMNGIVNISGGGDFVNAYWDGDNAFFGSGNCHYDPLTSIDVVTHEFTHGIIQETANLVYADEPGALNESMCDIMGKAVEYFYDNDNFSWVLGEIFINNPDAPAFRSMEDPNLYDDPKYYKGYLWEDGADVHYNSGVLNHWFYLLVEGGSGYTELAEPYSIDPLSMDDAMKTAFITLTQYMTESTTYPEAYELTLMVAKELFGENSPQENSIKEAWKAVGLPGMPSTTGSDIYDLRLTGGPNNENTCLVNEYYPIHLNVSNVGGQTITANTPLSFEFRGDAGDEFRSYTITDDFEPGESIDLVFDDVLFLDEQGFIFLVMELNYFNDENDLNDVEYGGFRNFITTETELSPTLFQRNQNTCYLKELDVTCAMVNNSCTTLPAGTPYELVLTRGGQVVYNESLVTQEDLISGQSERQFVTVDVDPDEDMLELELICDIDTDLSNNFAATFIVERPEIPSLPYTNQIESAFDLQNEIQLLNEYETNFLQYSGQNMLAMSNYNYFANNLICPEAERSFDQSGIPSLSFCLDVNSITNPHLSFDLAQFRSSYDPYAIEENQYYSMLMVRWESDSESGSELLFDMPPGIVLNHKIPLPQGFQGEVQILSYSHQGTGGYTTPSNLNSSDVNLIDNIRIYSRDPLSANELEEVAFKILPNPAKDIFILESDQALEGTIEIYDGTGSLRTSLNVKNQSEVNISNLSQGMYVVKYLDKKTNASYCQKLIKM